MQHIDKTNAAIHTAFKQVVDPYLQRGDYRYDALSPSDRVSLRSVLDNEQDGMCAYCMRVISVPSQTIDHIIPKDVSEQEFGEARNHLGRGLYRNDFIWDKHYDAQSYMSHYYYPHSLAYGNLVLACDDCNTNKGRHLIVPTFFENPMPVQYNDKGRVVIPKSEHFPRELVAHLNIDTFMKYRCLWSAVKQSGLLVQDVESADDDTKRKYILSTVQQFITWGGFRDKLMANLDGFVVESNWKVFVSFRWFWGYY